MDVNELRELVEIISRSGFSTFELERDGFKLRLVKEAPAAAPIVLVPESASAPAAPLLVAAPAPAAPAAERAAGEGLIDLPSPIVGTFYRQPGPGADPFVGVGDKVKKGQVLCIIEAMKLMNEIEAEIDAEIAEVCVQNGQPVEFGEVLFRLRPLA